MLILYGYLEEPYDSKVAVRPILPSEVEIENGKVNEKFLLDFLVKVANAKDEKIAEWANNLPFSEVEKLLNPDYFVKTFSVVYFNHDLSGRGYFFPSWYLEEHFYLKKFEAGNISHGWENEEEDEEDYYDGWENY
jgi:hypothetical protein